MSEVLVFDLSGRYGVFKTPETTRGAMTFPFPPRTAVLGLIGAVLGLPKNSYWASESFRNSLVGVEVLRPGRRWGATVNFTQTKSSLIFKSEGVVIPIPRNPFAVEGRGMNTQQRLDLVVDPKFRIYFSIEDADTMNRLGESLREHLFTYPPYLGHANLLGELEFVGRHAFERTEPGEYRIDSLASLSVDDKMRLRGDFVIVHGVPMSMTSDVREVEGEQIYSFGSADLVDSVAYQVSGQENPIVVNSKKPGIVVRVHTDPPKFVIPFPVGPARAA